MRTPDYFDRYDDEENPDSERYALRCARCGSTDVRWRQQVGALQFETRCRACLLNTRRFRCGAGMTPEQKLKLALVALRRIARLAGRGTVIYEIAVKVAKL